MKNIFLITGFITMFFISIVFNVSADSRTSRTRTFGIPGSSFTMTESILTIKTGERRDWSYRYEYQYSVNVKPRGEHAGLQRIEYVGFRVTYANTVAYYQLFPNGSIKRLANLNQALYQPSRIVTSPGSVGQYQLFQKPLKSRLNGTNVNVCLKNNDFFNWSNSQSIRAVHFMAGYGFLTQRDVDVINLQKQLENDPVIKAQMVKSQTYDLQTMKWALAQGNMFQKTSYYKVMDLNNSCYGWSPGRDRDR